MLVADLGVVVIDWVEQATEPLALSLPLHPDVAWDSHDRTATTRSGRRLHVGGAAVTSAVRGSTQPFDGWWSDTYGQMVPATRLELRARPDRALVWTMTHEPLGIMPDHDTPTAVRIGGLELQVSWDRNRVGLRVSGEGVDATRTIGALQ